MLYFGCKEKWTAPMTMRDFLEAFPEKLIDKINDYKINVYEIAFLPKETIDKFKSDFRIVADFYGIKEMIGSTGHQRKKYDILEP